MMVSPRQGDVELTRRVRRPLALLSLVGHPIAVAVLLWTPSVGIPQPLSAVVALAISLAALYAIWRVYQFRGHLAEAPDALLDERQRGVRDRAYFESYRLFVAAMPLVLLAAAILPDFRIGNPLALDFGTANLFIIVIAIVSVTLPSAVVAWREGDLDSDA